MFIHSLKNGILPVTQDEINSEFEKGLEIFSKSRQDEYYSILANYKSEDKYVELYEIINKFPSQDKNRVPKDFINFLIENMDQNYNFTYDDKKVY